MDFNIAIPGFNSPERVNWLLDSIFRFYPNVNPKKIIVSDDCSPNIEKIKAVAETYGVIFTHPQEWSCVGGNTNHILSLCKEDLVFVVNDDLVISKRSLEVMEKFCKDNNHLKIGMVGFTFIQDYQMKYVGILKSDGLDSDFYPPTWNTGDIRYNNYVFPREYAVFTSPFLQPILSASACGPCFAVRKTAWEECGKFHEFGMWEGGLAHAMWEKGWIIADIPNPPLLHARSRATCDIAGKEFLDRMFAIHPEKRPWQHDIGEELYRQRRGNTYYPDTEHIWKDIIRPKEREVLAMIKYDFDASKF